MNGNEFRQELDIKKPKYLAKYYNLMETISNKGSVMVETTLSSDHFSDIYVCFYDWLSSWRL